MPRPATAKSMSFKVVYWGPLPVTMTWSIGPGQILKELFEASEIGGIECRRAACADLFSRLLESVRIASGEDHVGAVGACEPGGLEARCPSYRRSRPPFDRAGHVGLRQRLQVMPPERAANTALVAVPNTRCADRSSPRVCASYSQIGLYTLNSGRIT